MVPPRHSSRLLGPILAVAVTVPLLVVAPAQAAPPAPPAAAPSTPAPAPPRTAAEARAQLGQLSGTAEQVSEDLNDATITLRKRQKEVAAADRQARTAQVQYGVYAGQVRRVISTAYRSAPYGQFASMLTSGSPQDFVEQLSALGVMADRRGQVLGRVAKVRTRALAAQARARTALVAAQKAAHAVQVKKTDLDKRGVVLHTLLSGLTGSDRAAYRAGADTTGRASRAATRGSVSVGPASGAAQQAARTALGQLGAPYSWGAAGPGSFDCSGLTLFAYASAGIGLPHSSRGQSGMGTKIYDPAQLRAGDLVFFYSPVHHVGLMINSTQMVHAPDYGMPVQVTDISRFPFSSGSRVG